jgi:sigma-B regulation protein RsbU (phosphoserine phosphatase)
MVFLEVIDGPEKGQTRELIGPKTIIGRHPECDIEVTVPAASRHHAQIVSVGDDFFVEDMHSRNGTYLNDEQLRSRTKLSEGDLIRVADSIFSFHGTNPEGDGLVAVGADRPVRTFMVEDDEASENLVCVSKVDAPSNSSQGTNLSAEILENQLTALSQISQRLQRVLELDKVLPEIIESLFIIFTPAERGFVGLQSDDGEFRTRWARLRDSEQNKPIRISLTICQQVMETQQAILSADAMGDERFASSKSLFDVPIRSLMCAPLIDKQGDSIGVLQIDTTGDRDRFQTADLRLLCSVASQASIAIENARLHEQVVRQRDIDKELQLAREIQRSFLPKDSPEIPGYEFFDYYQPANHVGGDFFDYIPMPDGRFAIVVADVVGHGVGAAMLTAKLAADVRYNLLSMPRPVDAINKLNESLSHDLIDDHFVTLALVVLSPDSGEVVVVNAGHIPPLRGTTDGRVVDLAVEESGWPLGIDGDTRYQQCSLQLDPGDLVMLITDGVNETINLKSEMYGIDRVREHVRGAPKDLFKLGWSIIDDLREYARGSDQSDDMCLICFARR